jgi:hypothetical protein
LNAEALSLSPMQHAILLVRSRMAANAVLFSGMREPSVNIGSG